MDSLPDRIAAVHARINPWIQAFVLLFLRVMIGWNFYITGSGKLRNLGKTTEFFSGLHIPAPGFHAMLVGYTEMVGGLLLVAGLATRWISVPLLISMCVAYLTAHREEAFQSIPDFVSQNPFPFLCVVLVTLAFGAGKFSLDAMIGCWWKSRRA
jgi:putative oxidoreductase